MSEPKSHLPPWPPDSSSFASSKEEPKPEPLPPPPPAEEVPHSLEQERALPPPPEVEKVAAVAATPQHWAKLKGTEDHVLAAICAGNKWDEHFIVTEAQYEEAGLWPKTLQAPL